MIKGQAFTTSLDDSSSGGFGEAKSSDLEAREFQKTSIVSDGADNDGGLVFLALHVARQAGDRDWGVVDLGHAKSLDDGVSELGFSTSADETLGR